MEEEKEGGGGVQRGGGGGKTVKFPVFCSNSLYFFQGPLVQCYYRLLLLLCTFLFPNFWEIYKHLLGISILFKTTFSALTMPVKRRGAQIFIKVVLRLGFEESPALQREKQKKSLRNSLIQILKIISFLYF